MSAGGSAASALLEITPNTHDTAVISLACIIPSHFCCAEKPTSREPLNLLAEPNRSYRHTRAIRTKIADSVRKDTVMAKLRHSRFDCSPGCAVEPAISLIAGT